MEAFAEVFYYINTHALCVYPIEFKYWPKCYVTEEDMTKISDNMGINIDDLSAIVYEHLNGTYLLVIYEN